MTATKAFKVVADVLTVAGLALLVVALVTTTAALALVGGGLIVASLVFVAARRALS